MYLIKHLLFSHNSRAPAAKYCCLWIRDINHKALQTAILLVFAAFTGNLQSIAEVNTLTDDTVVLKNGDVLHGKILELNEQQIRIKHPVLGEIIIARSDTEEITLLPENAELDIIDQPAAEEVIEKEETSEYPWKSHVDFGFSGSNGRTEKLDTRIMFNTEQTGEERRILIDSLYRNASSEGDRNLNIFTTGLEIEWPVNNSRWFGFSRGRFDYDEFARYGYRISGGAGLGYDFIRNDMTTLAGQIGLGAVREFNSPDEDIVPEAIFNLDWSHKLSEKQSVTAGVELIPELREIGDYRAILKAEWVVAVDFMEGANFKLGVRDDIEKRKENQQDDLLDFYAMLGFDF